uniref:Small ribosomal subunit protein mS31 n=1 Tax=Evadne anonyx TaxID=141404 RepID=A0A9N6ZFA3_9CRUS|nr:EOG090X04UC [Evadne anonyx]
MAIPLKCTMLRLSSRLVRLENSLRNICSSNSFYCKDDDHEDLNKTVPQQPTNENPKSKLNHLIQSMTKDKELKTSATPSVFVVPRVSKLKKKSKMIQPKTKIEPEMIEAVNKVTELFPEAKEDTRNVLINKLEAVENETELGKSAAVVQDPVNEVVQVLDENVKADKPKQVEIETKVKPPVKSGPSFAEFNSLLSQFKVDPKDKLNKFGSTSDSLGSRRGSLFEGTPLQIFQNVQFEESETTNQMKTWKKLCNRELQLSITNPPVNGFQQMIHLTQQGKLWQFPINNEQGMDEEARVGFHEHLFLEPYLNPWCPKRGPIRHFMELVCIGLSKNPYLTVSQKKEHINWFRSYFSAKRSILIETGALAESTSNELTV